MVEYEYYMDNKFCLFGVYFWMRNNHMSQDLKLFTNKRNMYNIDATYDVIK